MSRAWKPSILVAATVLVTVMVFVATASRTSGLSSPGCTGFGEGLAHRLRFPPGQPYSSFGGDGKLTACLPNVNVGSPTPTGTFSSTPTPTPTPTPTSPPLVDAANAVAIQTDGKLVAAGSSNSGDFRFKFALARYNPDGTLDTTFGGDGKVTTRFATTSFGEAFGVAIQDDGKIVAVGSSYLTHAKFALARYNPNGTLDTSFGGDGKVTTAFAARSDAEAFGVAIQDDGKIVAAGDSFLQDRSKFALARYNPNGTLDTTFGGDGKVTTRFATRGDAEAFGVAIQDDGKIVAGGDSIVSHGKFALARYNLNGTLDATFDGDGKVTTAFATRSDAEASGVALQDDGKIVVGGSPTSSTASSPWLGTTPTGHSTPPSGATAK
jgi:uncharacterized delta-60 repeat protein